MSIEAEKLFAQIFGRTQKRFSAVYTFRKASEAGLPLAKTEMLREAEEISRSLIFDDEYRFIEDREGFINSAGGFEGIKKTITQNELNSLRQM